MSGILRLESLTKGNTLKQGDKTPLKYRLFDADGENLNIAGKSAKVRLVYPDFLTIGYEKDGLTVAQDDTVTFTIDRVIPSRIYHVEIIVDDKFIFPSRADESKFTVDKSSLGTETNIIEIVGKDVLIQEVKSQVDTELQPLVTSLESAEQAETQRATAESSRVSAEEQRKIDHANRSAELAGKADKVVLKNLIENGNFESATPTPTGGVISDGILEFTGNSDIARFQFQTAVFLGHKYYLHFKLRYIADKPSSGSVSLTGVGYNFYYHHLLGEPNSWTTMSEIVEANRDTTTASAFIYLNGTAHYDDFILIDLTESFGVGNEPTKEEMYELIETTGYIDEYAINNKEMLGRLNRDIREKANKKQEDWITPTLLNGWTGIAGQMPVYMKDTLGFVHLKGTVTSGTLSSVIFNLPNGYRPSFPLSFPVIAHGTHGRLNVAPSGALVFAGGTPTTVYLDGIVYKGEF